MCVGITDYRLATLVEQPWLASSFLPASSSRSLHERCRSRWGNISITSIDRKEGMGRRGIIYTVIQYNKYYGKSSVVAGPAVCMLTHPLTHSMYSPQPSRFHAVSRTNLRCSRPGVWSKWPTKSEAIECWSSVNLLHQLPYAGSTSFKMPATSRYGDEKKKYSRRTGAWQTVPPLTMKSPRCDSKE